MEKIRSFLTKETPKAGKNAPVYYRRALAVSEELLGLYFLIHFFLFPWKTGGWELFPLLMLFGAGACEYSVRRRNVLLGFLLFGALCMLWCGWYVRQVGWGCGGQHFLLPLLLLCFFNIFMPPWGKIGCFLALIGYRMLLFSYSQSNDPVFALTTDAGLAFQTLNSTTLFVLMASVCTILSNSIQETERQLRLDNQELSREAETDPLTGLPNRRFLIGQMQRYLAGGAREPFCAAIADIDFFKHVNDTYGHPCGDYALSELASLFRQAGLGRYQCARWGGEEFCFFLPGVNLDEAGTMMNDLAIAVSEHPFSFEGNDFTLTITIGVAEYDFLSSLETLLDEADKKLYMGKNNGRNQVVM
jgi:diguanylate cyclase (GGDEF)-like protein